MKKSNEYRQELEKKMREIINYDLKTGRLGGENPIEFFVEERDDNGLYALRKMGQEEFIELLFTPIIEVVKKFPDEKDEDIIGGGSNSELIKIRMKIAKTYEEKARQELEYESSVLANSTAIKSMWISVGSICIAIASLIISFIGIIK